MVYSLWFMVYSLWFMVKCWALNSCSYDRHAVLHYHISRDRPGMAKGTDTCSLFYGMRINWPGRCCEIISRPRDAHEIGPSHDEPLVARIRIYPGFYIRHPDHPVGGTASGETYQIGFTGMAEQTGRHSVVADFIYFR